MSNLTKVSGIPLAFKVPLAKVSGIELALKVSHSFEKPPISQNATVKNLTSAVCLVGVTFSSYPSSFIA